MSLIHILMAFGKYRGLKCAHKLFKQVAPVTLTFDLVTQKNNRVLPLWMANLYAKYECLS